MRGLRAQEPPDIEAISANRPDGITRGELLDMLYADDPDGGPVGAAQALV